MVHRLIEGLTLDDLSSVSVDESLAKLELADGSKIEIPHPDSETLHYAEQLAKQGHAFNCKRRIQKFAHTTAAFTIGTVIGFFLTRKLLLARR